MEGFLCSSSIRNISASLPPPVLDSSVTCVDCIALPTRLDGTRSRQNIPPPQRRVSNPTPGFLVWDPTPKIYPRCGESSHTKYFHPTVARCGIDPHSGSEIEFVGDYG